jgi:N-acetylmuramoyl-L-alanine amidase
MVEKKTVATKRDRSSSKLKSGAAAGLYAHYVMSKSGHAAKPAVKWDPSPNHASRQGNTIQRLVLHNTDGPLAGSLARLKDPASQVSAHYVIDRNGDIYQLVADSETAWHSGNKAVNQQSIGIEIVAWKSVTGLATAQENALVAIAKFVLDTYDVALSNVIPHRAVKATDCPGWVWKDDPILEEWKSANLVTSL